jgi:tetratricopeptide (TPR) repeat protein
MSLLIKALDKAQAEKAKAKNNAEKSQSTSDLEETPNLTLKKPFKKIDATELSLSPAEENLATGNEAVEPNDDMPKALKGSAADVSQTVVQQPKEKLGTEEHKKPEAKLSLEKASAPTTQRQAANVFASKQASNKNQTAKLAILVGIVALALLASFAYWYQSVFNAPDIIIPPRPASISQEMPAPMPDITIVEDEGAEVAQKDVVQEVVAQKETVQADEKQVTSDLALTSVDVPVKEAKKQERPKSILAAETESPDVVETLASNETMVTKSNNIVRSTSLSKSVGIASESASIDITQTKTESGVNPILMRAYEAYNAGNDNQAQQDYKQVLQRYGANVDAMLGLGAIASRQGRLADANGWYQKVLEVEPRNEVANAGLLSIQQNAQPQHSESAIKSMIATTPNDANLYAALGDLYAKSNQWSIAQQAYFDAYRLNSSAENAFNLGVSLDHLGKSNLALPYYQEALQKSDQSGVIDTVALEARISTIQ